MQLTSTIKGEDERETRVSLFCFGGVDWETTGAGAIYCSLGEYMVVYRDYRCLLTGSSLVDYNDDEITPLPYSTIQFLPSSTRTFYLVAGSLVDYTSIYYHLHYHILEGVVWETTGA